VEVGDPARSATVCTRPFWGTVTRLARGRSTESTHTADSAPSNADGGTPEPPTARVEPDLAAVTRGASPPPPRSSLRPTLDTFLAQRAERFRSSKDRRNWCKSLGVGSTTGPDPGSQTGAIRPGAFAVRNCVQGLCAARTRGRGHGRVGGRRSWCRPSLGRGQLGIRDAHMAVVTRGAQHVKDRVISHARRIRKPAQIPSRDARIRVELSE